MDDTRLPVPGEPAEVRARARKLLEETPGEGTRLVDDATFVADPLWNEWSEELLRAGMDRERFLSVARGYAAEIRLWVVGERPWQHCAAGLAGRVSRRLPEGETPEETVHDQTASLTGVCR